MESIDSSPNSLTQRIYGLSKARLQELCEGITRHINDYDILIRQQMSLPNKNYKLMTELCERKLELLSIYKRHFDKSPIT